VQRAALKKQANIQSKFKFQKSSPNSSATLKKIVAKKKSLQNKKIVAKAEKNRCKIQFGAAGRAARRAHAFAFAPRAARRAARRGAARRAARPAAPHARTGFCNDIFQRCTGIWTGFLEFGLWICALAFPALHWNFQRTGLEFCVSISSSCIATIFFRAALEFSAVGCTGISIALD